MVALTMAAPWLSSSVTVAALLAVGFTMLVIQADQWPSARRMWLALLVVLLFVGSCVLFASEGVPLATCTVYEPWSTEWVLAGCWMWGWW
jgi:hypothetical protein